MFDYVQVALSLLLLASLGGNLFFYFQNKATEAKRCSAESEVADLKRVIQETPPQKKFYDAEAFMQDMARYGLGLIKVARVDPDDVVIRSPRDRK